MTSFDIGQLAGAWLLVFGVYRVFTRKARASSRDDAGHVQSVSGSTSKALAKWIILGVGAGVVALSVAVGAWYLLRVTRDSRVDAGRSERALDLLLDTRELRWVHLMEGRHMARADVEALRVPDWATRPRQPSEPIAEKVRRLLREGECDFVEAYVGQRRVSMKDVQQLIGREDSSTQGEIRAGTSPEPGIWYRYGAVEIAADQVGLVAGFRVDVRRWKQAVSR